MLEERKLSMLLANLEKEPFLACQQKRLKRAEKVQMSKCSCYNTVMTSAKVFLHSGNPLSTA